MLNLEASHSRLQETGKQEVVQNTWNIVICC